MARTAERFFVAPGLLVQVNGARARQDPYRGKGRTRLPLDGHDPERLLEDFRVTCARLGHASGMILAARLPDRGAGA